jgi:hypothetical protein
MDSGPKRPSQSYDDTLPEIPPVIDRPEDEVARAALRVRHRRAVRQAFEAGAAFAKDAPEMALELIMGSCPSHQSQPADCHRGRSVRAIGATI